MIKYDYLKRVINETNLYEYKSWYISCFSILLPITNYDINKYKKLELIRLNNGLFTILINENNEKYLEKIDDYKEDESLFNFGEEIEIDTTWKINVKEKRKVKIGNLLINKVTLYSVLENRIDFIDGKISCDVFESLFVNKVKDDNELKEGDISIKEMIIIIDRLYFFTNIAEIVNITATEKNITAPDNIEKEREKLLKEYGDLTSQTKLNEFEEKLKKIDSEYLKDDPTNGIVLTGKSKQARKKMFLTFGYDKEFVDKVKINPIIESLEEGLNTDKSKFPEYMNSLRFGSFARGALTAESGTQTKILLRSLGSITISKQDCGTTKGVKRLITKDNFKKLINRRVKNKNEWKLVNTIDEAKEYIDKEVEIRSALYCKSPKNSLCYFCTSEIFKDQENAIFHLSTEMSSIMMTMFLKLMHDSSLTNTQIHIEDFCK